MKKVNKEFLNELYIDSVDHVYKNNSSNMRERFSFFMKDGSFISLEGNTNGWFVDDCKDFSNSVYWVMAC